MSNYFSYFPKVNHDLTGDGNYLNVTNILRRFKFRSNLELNNKVFYEYDVQDGDRPDTIAHKYYDDSNLAWVVLHFNNITDPFFGWPLFGEDFENYVKGKYGSISNAQATVHEYRIFIREKEVLFDGTVVDELYYVADLTTYNAYSGYKETVTKWDWEVEKNDAKRKIKLLDAQFINQLRDEVDIILRDYD